MKFKDKIRGVNLGGWLVLEKWMTPYLYEGLDAEDEYHVLKQLGDKAEPMLKVHRDTFFMEEDFKWLHDHGVNSVRLPVGHWLFNGLEPYFSAKKYVDFTFEMAGKYDLSVLLDIHAAPGCQNGFDNGGLSGIMEWHNSEANINRTIEFAEELAKEYKEQSSLLGIQLLNEPHWDVDLSILQDYYTKGYHAVRKYLDEDRQVVIHDGFRLNQWKEFMRESEYKNVILDTHFYQCFGEEAISSNPYQHIYTAAITRKEQIEEMQEFFPVIIGEWSVGLNGKSYEGYDQLAVEALHRAYANAQLLSYNVAAGWYFWSLKVNSELKGGWDFREIVRKGWFPKSFK
jgi:glucan 1,3-beta-glucosidase